MVSWEELDKEVITGITDSKVVSGMLSAQVSVLIIKKLITKHSTCGEVQQALLARYDVEYKLQDIEDELICLNVPEDVTLEIEEDYFGGY